MDTEMEDSNEKKKQNRFLTTRQIRYAAATAIVLLSLLGLSAAFVIRVYFMTESSCYEDLAVTTEDAITDLETKFRSDRTTLRVMAGLIGNADDIASLEVSGYLTNYDINSMITQIGMLLPGDVLVNSKGRRTKTDGEISFEAESKQGEHISRLQAAGANPANQVIRNYVPIRKDGICIGVLYSSASPSSIAKAWLPSIYNKKGSCYVVDRKTGEVLINTSSDPISNIRDIDFIQTDAAYAKDGTVSNILDGKKGYSVFSSQLASEKFYMCYLPFSIEDWEMVVFVPESAVFSAVDPIRNWMYLLIASVAVIVLLYALWLIREIRAALADAEQKANIDVLTGLPNRNRYEGYLKTLEGSRDKLICLYIDANGLHELNNSKGHFAGDQMLRFIADTLKVEFGGEHIYRIGGDEFIVFLSDKTETEVEHCLKNFNDALQRNDYHAAVGTSEYEGGMSVDHLIEHAEKAMYESKQKYYEQLGKVMRV